MSPAQIIAATIVIIASIAGMGFGIIALIRSGVEHMDDYSDWNDHA